MIALIDGLIENQNQLETKVDQLLSAIQPSADKTNTKTSAKKNTA